MPAYVALLRAVNVGGTGKLPMVELKAMADAIGFLRARTYIASGNLLFDSEADERQVKTSLEARLADYARKPVAVLVRTAAEMVAIRDANPFATAPGNRVFVTLLDAPPPADAADQARHVDEEQIVLGDREIYVRYTDHGIATSRLVIPAALIGTARNMNTIAKLADLLASPP